MAKKIQQYRGLEKDLPRLEEARIAFTTDTKKLFIGSNNGNIEITNEGFKNEIISQLEETNDRIIEHLTGDNNKHVEVVDEIPLDLTGKGVLFKKQEGVSTTPNKPTIQDLTERVENLEMNGGGGGSGSDNTLQGLVANNTSVDNKTVLQQAFGNLNIDLINLPSGTFNTTRISVSIKNKVIKGVPAKTILQTNGAELLFLQDSENVIFEDITFSTLLDSEENGAITANGSALKNITFKRCKFTTVGSNGVKIVNESTKISDFITFEDCIFENIGRMGVEFQNHNDNVVASRYSNITFANCLFKNIGTKIHGMGISMSGLGEWVTIKDCKFVDCWGIGIELIGANYVTIDNNNFIGYAKQFELINVTNERNNDFITIINNKSNGTLGTINLWNGINMLFANNQFYGIRTMYIKRLNHSKFLNNVIVVRTGEAMFFDNAHHNEILGNTLDTRNAPENWTVCKFYGVLSTRNKVFNNHLYKSDGGLHVGATDGANNNDVGENYHSDTKLIGYGQNLALQSIGQRVMAVNNKTIFTIEFVKTSYWFTFMLDIVCMGVEDSGGNLFNTTLKVYGKAHESIEFTRVDGIVDPKINIEVTKNANKLTFTCTNSTPAQNTTAHSWVINAVCQQPILLS